MASDFSNIAVTQCVGCGRGPDQVMLMRLRTYSRSFCCGACFLKYANCGNVNPEGKKCTHPPTEHLKKTGPCQQAGCGCPAWRHGLEDELDRQFADCVGKQARVKECTGYGTKTGKCGRLLFAQPDGTIPRLCDLCQREWINQVKDGAKDAALLLDLDPSKVEMPN